MFTTFCCPQVAKKISYCRFKNTENLSVFTTNSIGAEDLYLMFGRTFKPVRNVVWCQFSQVIISFQEPYIFHFCERRVSFSQVDLSPHECQIRFFKKHTIALFYKTCRWEHSTGICMASQNILNSQLSVADTFNLQIISRER